MEVEHKSEHELTMVNVGIGQITNKATQDHVMFIRVQGVPVVQKEKRELLVIVGLVDIWGKPGNPVEQEVM